MPGLHRRILITGLCAVVVLVFAYLVASPYVVIKIIELSPFFGRSEFYIDAAEVKKRNRYLAPFEAKDIRGLSGLIGKPLIEGDDLTMQRWKVKRQGIFKVSVVAYAYAEGDRDGFVMEHTRRGWKIVDLYGRWVNNAHLFMTRER